MVVLDIISVVGVKGLEPSTSRSQTARASQLRHTPTVPLSFLHYNALHSKNQDIFIFKIIHSVIYLNYEYLLFWNRWGWHWSSRRNS